MGDEGRQMTDEAQANTSNPDPLESIDSDGVVAADDSADANDIAVVGMANRFPDAATPDEFWENLREGLESARTYTEEELRAAGVPEAMLADPNYVKGGTPLADFDLFDAEFFGLGPKDAAIADPQHRVLLEVAWECLERAGHVPSRFDGDIGVFAGCGMSAYFIYNLLSNPDLVNQVGTFLLRHTSNDKDFLATRVSYALDLTGPSVSTQTACSTSLVAIHQAAQSLLQHECDLALAGGVTIEIPHRVGYLYHEGEPLSPDGHCRAFDHRSQGTIFGSGAGMVALRRLSDAIADGDQILAVIKGSAVNNDGAGKVSYLAPSVDGQAAAVSEAIGVADVDPATVQYIECHGTGTPMGDPIEIAALNEAYGPAGGPNTIGIGSVKPNIGHLDTAAGVASFIKLVQALRHREMPPCINFEAPNPTVDFAGGPFYVNDRVAPWPEVGDIPPRGGVSSLGVGGTNAHVVVEAGPDIEQPSGPSNRRAQLLMVSGRNQGAVAGNGSRLADLLDGDDAPDLADVAYSLHTTRHHFGTRCGVVATSAEDAVARLRSGDSALLPTRQTFHDHANVCYLFPGGASQYPNMGRGLYENEPVYREVVDAGFARLREVHDIDLQPLLYPEPGTEAEFVKLLAQTDNQLPAIFLTELALARLYESWGITPRAMAGHSWGEMTAACIAGVFSFEDCLDLAVLRAQLVDSCEEGGVLSVNLSADDVEPYLYGRLVVASVNAPNLTVVSGTAQEIRELTTALLDAGVEIREIPLRSAAHSPLFDPILPAWEEKLRSIELSPPTMPVASNLTGGWLSAEQATDPMYWVRHFRHTVRFGDNVSLLLEQPGTVLVEMGPGRALSSFARSSADIVPQQPVLSSLRHPDQEIDDDLYVLDIVGRVWAAGVDLDADAFYAGEQRRRVELPTYAFQHQRYFIEPGEARVTEGAGRTTLHRGAEVADWFHQAVWHEAPGAPGESLEPCRWLVFTDKAGVGDELVDRLRADGHDVAVVREGDSFAKLGDRSYVLAPETARVGYDQLLAGLVEDEFVPDRVVHLWTLTTDKRVRAGSSWYHHMQERGFLCLVHLAQATGDQLPDAEQAWTVVTNGALPVDAKVSHPEKATLLGPATVIPHEYATIDISVIDVEMPQTGASKPVARVLATAERLLARAQGKQLRAQPEIADVSAFVHADLKAADPGAVIGYRQGRRYVRSYDRVPVTIGEHGRLRDGGTYLVTGGLGGLGLHLADRLARSWNARLVLVGRSPLPERDRWPQWLAEHGPGNATSKKIRKLLALEGLGVEYMTAAADVADLTEMEQVVTEAVGRFGRIDGVIHAAGVVEENLIAMKTEMEMDKVFEPKVQGAMVIDQVMEPHHPDFILYFSSTSTALGIPGQVDYAAANAFLDAYAQRPRRTAEPEVLSLAWGPWREVGLAAESSADDVGDAFEPCPHPLLDYVSVDDDHTVGTVELSSERMWVIDEHRTEHGRALMPGTGHVEMFVSTALAAGAESVEIANLSFLTPLAVPDGIIRDARVVMSADSSGTHARLQSAAHGSASGWQTHSETTVRSVEPTEPGRLDLDAIRARCTARAESDEAGIRTRQEDHVRFGPRWRNLRSIRWGDGEAVAELALRPELVDEARDFNLHPALLDMATGFGLPLTEGYDELDQVPMYVPMTYGRLRWHAPLEARIFSHLRLRDVSAGANLVRFDITLTDGDGTVLVDIENFAMVRLTDEQAFADPAAATGALGAVGDVASAEVMFQRFLEAGIEPDEGWDVFERVMESTGPRQLFVSPLPMQPQIELIDTTLAGAGDGTRFERPDLASEYREPTDEVERGLVQLWEELLGVDPIGIDDDFFELGGHSLIALRLFASIKQRFGVDQPMSVLFDAPTVARLADHIRAEVGDGGGEMSGTAAGGTTATAMRHVVQIAPDPGKGTAPLFLVAGMFGNILNLRHLGLLIGDDRAVYGIQARGLVGDEEPHERFDDAARDYIAEIKQVQPEGPYFIGGFSGGGFAAYEMAHQLTNAGDEVAMVILLDTPVPGLGGDITRTDKIMMHLQTLERLKHRWLIHYVQGKLRYKREQRRIDNTEMQDHDFRTSAIEAAHMRAVEVNEPKAYDGDVHVYRPRLNVSFRLSGARYVDHNLNFQVEDNGWTPWVRNVFVREVPGDHDSMVLEPNVRVLAGHVVDDIAAVEAALREREEARAEDG